MDCPSGVLTRDKVFEMLSVSLPAENGKIVSDLIFSTFDKDKNNFIDFNEFIIATHCTANSSPEDKLRWVFQLYDKVSNIKESGGDYPMGVRYSFMQLHIYTKRVIYDT